MPLSPEQSMSQRDNALQKANEVRLSRARLLRSLRTASSRREALALLADHIEKREGLIEGVPISSLIRQCHRCGPTFAHKVLRELELTSTVSLCSLSDARRGDVVSALRHLAK